MNKYKLQSSSIVKAKPFVKWAGGKGQLLRDIESNLPNNMSSIKKYIEPFVGGGAVLFYMLGRYNFEKVMINDFNKELIRLYKTIKENVDSLINELSGISSNYFQLPEDKRKEFFLRIRKEYNEKNLPPIKKSAYFIFLNRTCFNGLYRVNKKGYFNVPFGRYKNPRILDEENLRAVSKALQNVTILNGDFEIVEKYVDERAFVYFDPPYRPLSKTSNFNSYHKEAFGDDEQKRLANFYKRLDSMGAKLMLSNSDPKNTDANENFFEDLYRGYRIIRVEAKRNINSNAKKRAAISELLILNY